MSAVSPATEAEPKQGSPAQRAKAAKKGSTDTDVAVSLEHARWRHFGWIAFGAIAGGVLIWKLGSVGKGVGIFLLVIAALNLRSFALTLLNQPGTIRIDGEEASLPRGLCRGAPHTIPVAAIKHAFFLRRAVPWTRSGPILIIETSDQVFTYPREWFASDSDQRRIAVAVNRRLGRL